MPDIAGFFALRRKFAGRLTWVIRRAKQAANNRQTARVRGIDEMAKGRTTRGNKRVASNTIAFQGEAGANSDMACRSAFPYMTTLPCPPRSMRGSISHALAPRRVSRVPRESEVVATACPVE